MADSYKLQPCPMPLSQRRDHALEMLLSVELLTEEGRGAVMAARAALRFLEEHGDAIEDALRFSTMDEPLADLESLRALLGKGGSGG